MRRIAWGLLLGVLVCATTAPAAAQSADDGWQVVAAPYLMGAAMSGTTTVHGVPVETKLSASQVFDNLQFGAMGVLVAHKGKWGFGSDIMWAALGSTVKTANANVNVDVNQGLFSFYGLRDLGPAAYLTFGARINTLQSELTFTQVNDSRSQDKTWVDPVVGLMLHSSSRNRMMVRLYTEIGGFGAGSDFTWQIGPSAGVRITDRASFEFGWRWLHVDYESGTGLDKFGYDMLTQGPVTGFAFRF